MSIIVPQRKKGPQYVQEVAPSSPEVGDTWYDSNLEKFMMYTTDNEWVEFEKIGGNPGSPYGYVCGGEAESTFLSTIDRFSFPFDSGTATHVGNLSVTKECDQGGCNSSDYGYISSLTESSSNNLSNIERITFPFDSGTSLHVGNLTGTRCNLSSCNSSLHGYSCGGLVPNEIYFSIIDRITFPFDSGTATHIGNLGGTKAFMASCNSSNYGYICGGYLWSGDVINISAIDRFSFPFDSGTVTHVGNISGSKQGVSSCNSSNYGYCCSGWVYYGSGDPNNKRFSTIERITFPFDSGTASHVGNLTDVMVSSATCNSSNHGYCCGGWGNSNKTSIINRITFPFDSGTATQVSTLSVLKAEEAGVDGTDFCTLFVD